MTLPVTGYLQIEADENDVEHEDDEGTKRNNDRHHYYHHHHNQWDTYNERIHHHEEIERMHDGMRRERMSTSRLSSTIQFILNSFRLFAPFQILLMINIMEGCGERTWTLVAVFPLFERVEWKSLYTGCLRWWWSSREKEDFSLFLKLSVRIREKKEKFSKPKVNGC